MEPLTIGLLGLGAYVVSRIASAKKSANGNAGGNAGETASNFPPFPPDQQGQAWYAACSLQWTEIAPQRDAVGRVARAYRGTSAGDPASNRMTNDLAFRAMQKDGFRIAVSESVLYGGGVPTLLAFEDGFSAAALPAELGTLRLLYTPPPGSLGQPPGPNPGPIFNGSVDPGGLAAFEELPEPARTQARELYQSDTASLYELAKTADELDKAGYRQSASALRRRRDALLLSRGIEANKRGGWLYVVRIGDLPINVARYYGGNRPRVLSELAAVNDPKVSSGGTWKGWHGGDEVLLPSSWPDPALKPLPPLASGGGGGNAQGQGAPAGGTPPGGFSSVMTPWGLYSTNAPLPPGTTATPIQGGGQEAFPVPPGSTAPNGFVWGPPWIGKWTPPAPGGIDPNKGGGWFDFAGQSQSPADFGQTTDVGITPASFRRN